MRTQRQATVATMSASRVDVVTLPDGEMSVTCGCPRQAAGRPSS